MTTTPRFKPLMLRFRSHGVRGSTDCPCSFAVQPRQKLRNEAILTRHSARVHVVLRDASTVGAALQTPSDNLSLTVLLAVSSLTHPLLVCFQIPLA